MPTEISPGLFVETVGDILQQGEAAQCPASFVLPGAGVLSPIAPASGTRHAG